MKAFKKLMAAALVCVMALTVLTGCAVSDNIAEKKLVEKLNDVSSVSYTHKKDLDDEAQKAWNDNKDAEGSAVKEINGVSYTYVIVKKPSDANKKDSWGEKAKAIDEKLATVSAKNSDKKIEIGVKIVEGKNSDYAVVVAKLAK